MNERFKRINEFLEEEIEKIIDSYDYLKKGHIVKGKHETEEIEDLFIQTLIGYMDQKKKFIEEDEILN